MGQAKPFSYTALVVEDDPLQRGMLALLLEESDMSVVECESAEAAAVLLDRYGSSLTLMITDINLAGNMTGVELAHLAKREHPDLSVIVMSAAVGDPELPDGATFMPKPWVPLDVLREVARAQD